MSEQPTKRRRAPLPESIAETIPPPAPVFYRARRMPIHHPYQGVLVPVVGQVPLYFDNWVEVQLKAGVIERV
jgi:hypothetical protein